VAITQTINMSVPIEIAAPDPGRPGAGAAAHEPRPGWACTPMTPRAMSW